VQFSKFPSRLTRLHKWRNQNFTHRETCLHDHDIILFRLDLGLIVQTFTGPGVKRPDPVYIDYLDWWSVSYNHSQTIDVTLM
jgi:hypothetical protein